MKFVPSRAIVALIVAGGFAAPALANADLAKKYNCLGCHAEDKKLVGPAYNDIAAKYKGNKEAEAKVLDQIKKGGSGAWGAIPMPPQPTVTDADAKALAQWILKR
jgi:cytochrome c